MNHITRRFYYFDAIGILVASVIGARVATLAFLPGWTWTTRTAGVIAMFAVAGVMLAAQRKRAYTQATPWLAGAYAATAALAMLVVFWPLHVIWFLAVVTVGGGLLVVALVMRTRRLGEPLTQSDAFQFVGLGLGVVLTLALCEAGLRLMPGLFGPAIRQVLEADPRNYGVAHPYIGHLHTPGGAPVVAGKDFRAVHQVDPAGFRNAWPWPERPDIVVVGDSVTFGYGAAGDEAWPARLARSLPGDPLVNLALIGAGPQQYQRVYETFGARLRPRLLLVGVFASNDFWDAEVFDDWLRSGAGGNYVVWRDFGRPGPLRLSMSDPAGSLRRLFDRFVYPVLRVSRTYNLLRAFRDGFEGAASAGMYVELADGGRIQLGPGGFRSRAAMGEAGSRSFRLALEAFLALHAQASADGTHVLFVLQPGKEEVYLPLLEEDVPDPARALKQAFDERGIEYLDLGPAFRQRAAAGKRLFFEEDGHPNPAGYALMARLVLEHVNRNRQRYGLDEETVLQADTRAGVPGAGGPQ